jgi:hypothetical protein
MKERERAFDIAGAMTLFEYARAIPAFAFERARGSRLK